MRFVKENDKGKAVCSSCGLTTITYLLKDVPFSNKSGTVKNILAGVCDKCNEVITIPAQSTAAIKSEYNKTRKPLEIRVPAHYIDILNLACQKIDKDLDESFFKPLLTFYVHGLKKENCIKLDAKILLNSDLAKAKSSKRLSFKLSNKTEKELMELVDYLKIKNKSELIKAIILKINEDIVQSKKPKNFTELKNLAYAFC
ncbi:MAG: hypothetical protein U0457_12645 [Candidatus Sericytochromatia bacterium]